MAFDQKRMAVLLAEIGGQLLQGLPPSVETVHAAQLMWPYKADSVMFALFVILGHIKINTHTADDWRVEGVALLEALCEGCTAPTYQR